MPDVDVNREVQKMIHLFGRLNNKRHEVEDKIKELKDKLGNLEDAQTELMLLDEEEDVRYAVGDTYSEFSTDTANEMVEAETEEAQRQVEEEGEKLSAIEEQMSDLKTKLYAKFGKSINLEETPQ